MSTALDLRPAHNDAAIPHAPANIEAEQALLGVLLYDNAAFERLGDFLQARHFYEPFHQRLFTAIESAVRKGQLAEPILALADRPTHAAQLFQRALVRFALACPGTAAAAHIARMRQKDPQAVKDAEELLRGEKELSQRAAGR